MNLTENFSLAELTASATAQRRGIDNHPGLEIISHLAQLAMHLERVRHALGDKPMIISSGYRCPDLNQAVGGARRSAHMEGWAADFTCPDFGSPLQIVKALAEFERGLIRERTRAGLEAARARGRSGGRKPKLDAKQIRHIKALLRDPNTCVAELARDYGVSRTTIYKHCGVVQPRHD